MLLCGALLCLSLPPVEAVPFPAAQREKLAQLVRSDGEAARLFQKFQRLADASLSEAPRPVHRLATAGKLASDPAKQESRVALEDMKKLEALGLVSAATAQPAYGIAAKRMILAWVDTYQPTGEPIDETKLEPLFQAYGLTRQVFSAPERGRVESWLRRIARQEQEAVRPASVTASNNWNGHRLKIIAYAAFLLEDRALLEQVVDGFKRQIESDLRPDGSSLDFHERDALHYHCYTLEPLLTLAMVARQAGFDLYEYESPSGASLRRSVAFLVPYCTGAATHREWVHSKVAFDRDRAQAGEPRFQTGALFPQEVGLRTLALASFFDDKLAPIVARLSHRESAARFPVWQSVLNEVLRT
jgi:hypothetical protein